jgi:U3 small nucleolar RNA-associated protein 13
MKAVHDGLSRDWIVSRRHGSSFTSGALSFLSGGPETKDYAACLCSDRVALLHIPSGLVARFVSRPSAEEAVSFAAASDGSKLVVFYRNLMARLFDPRELLKEHRRKLLAAGDMGSNMNEEDYETYEQKKRLKTLETDQDGGVGGGPIKSWRLGHRLQVTCAEFDQSSTLVVTGSADKSVMVYDAEQGFATHSFKNGHDELITCVRFQPHTVSVQRIVSASSDGRVCVWDLISHSCVASLAGQHYSAVTSIIFSTDPNAHYMLTCGRDKVINVWDSREFSNPTSTNGSTSFLKATVAAQEGIESAVMLPADAVDDEGSGSLTETINSSDDQGRSMTFVTVGDRGLLRKWTLNITGTSRAQRKFAVRCISTQTSTGLKRRLACSSADDSAISLSTKTDGSEEVPVSQQFEHVLLQRETAPPLRPKASDEKSQRAQKAAGKRRRRSSEVDTEMAATATASTLNNTEASPRYVYRLLCVTRDQVLTFTSVSDLKAIKVICGYNDQIIDVRYIPGPLSPSVSAPSTSTGSSNQPSKARSLLAVATNSEQLRIVDGVTFDTTLCDGHEDAILSLSPSPEGTLIATASKDKTVRIWDVATGTCISICEGHTESVSAVSFPSKQTAFTRLTTGGAAAGSSSWVVSAGKDHSLKVWQLAPLLSLLPSPRPEGWSSEDLTKCVQSLTTGRSKEKSFVFKPRTISSAMAHEKEINAVAVSPNDKIIASASQDRTIKLWSAPDLSPGGQPVATLRGHKRGVWSIAFSPSDQVLASASGDGTLRLWAVSSSAGYACLRTFEGHDGSALCVRFLRRGLQLVSSGADGLVKLWSVKDAECINTFDAHTEKIWALAVRPGEFNEPLEASIALAAIASGSGTTVALDEREIASGGGDSVLNIWRDVTSKTAQSEVAAAEEAIQKQQSLLGAMATRDYNRTLSLTLELDQPGRCGDVLQELLEIGPTPPAPASGAEAEHRNAEAILTELDELNEEANGLVNKETKRRIFFGMHEAGAKIAASVISLLSGALLSTLLRFVREWGTQARHGFLAQRVLFIILKTIPQKDLVRKLAEEKFIRSSRGTGASTLKMLPGIGAARFISKPGALDEEADLAPIAVPVSSIDTNSGVVGALLESESKRLTSEEKEAEISSAAASELRGLISSLLPYSERHLERLDRLLISTHSVDHTLHSMQALIPSQMDEDENDKNLAYIGRGTTLRARSLQEQADDDDDDEEDEETTSPTRWIAKAAVVEKKASSKKKLK